MNHSTSEKKQPSKECLNFIRTFARIYSPDEDNEDEARRLAALAAYPPLATC